MGLPAGAGRGWLAFQMSVSRGFTAYLHTLDPAVPVSPVAWRGGSAAIAKRRLTSGEGFESVPVRCTKLVSFTPAATRSPLAS